MMGLSTNFLDFLIKNSQEINSKLSRIMSQIDIPEQAYMRIKTVKVNGHYLM